MLLNLFLKTLSLLGRRKDFYTFAGEHIATRWYFLYEEEDEDTRWIAKFPNIYFHHTLVEHPDGPDTHRHAWNSWSWCLRGGYSEWVNGLLREHKAFGIIALKANEFHRIVTCKPGSITMWIRGFRQGKWAFKMKPCDTICSTCATNYGRCLNEFTELSHDEYFGGKGNRRASGWFKPTQELEKKMARRRAAIQHYSVKVQSRDQVMADASRKAHDSKST